MNQARFTKGNWMIHSSSEVSFYCSAGVTGLISVHNANRAETYSNVCLIHMAPDLYAEIERDLIEQLKTQELIKGKLVDEQLNASIVRKQTLLEKARGEL